MVFFYPQKTSLEMGATEILPGTQYWNVDREDDGITEGKDRFDPNFNVEILHWMKYADPLLLNGRSDITHGHYNQLFFYDGLKPDIINL